MVYNTMDAWSRRSWERDGTTPTSRRSPQDAVAIKSASDPTSSDGVVSQPLPPPLTSPPSFRETTSRWSPPSSPGSTSPTTSKCDSPVEYCALPVPAVQPVPPHKPRVSTPITPLLPRERHDLVAKLYAAACSGDLKLISHLLAQGAPINGITVVPNLYDSFKPAKSGRLSALAGAAGNAQMEAARLLLASGAILNPSASQSSSSPLHEAVRGDRLEMVRFLLRHGADIDICNCYKATPLMYAAKYASPEMTSLVLSYHPDLGAESFASTATYWGLWSNRVRNVELCLQAGADARHEMTSGDTPLHCAALSGLTEMAELLLKYGADPLKKNDERKTPLDMARENGTGDIVRLLRRVTFRRLS